jgi:hypothetical protein
MGVFRLLPGMGSETIGNPTVMRPYAIGAGRALECLRENTIAADAG